MSSRFKAAAILVALAMSGCSGEPETIMVSGKLTEEQAAVLKQEQDVIAAQEKANLSGARYVPVDEDMVRVEREEKANNAGLSPK